MPEEPVGSPRWWLRRLSKQLKGRANELQRHQEYFDGKHPLAFASKEFQSAFGGMFEQFADNWCPLVVNACEQRLNVEGFRFGTGQEMRDRDGAAQQADTDAWEIWQRNQLDVFSQMGHMDALTLARSAVLVWLGDDERPQITVESPFELIYERVPGSLAVAAALKEWRDDWTGRRFATLYLPDAIHKFQTRRGRTGFTANRWDDRVLEDEESPLPNPLGRVPVVPLENQPRTIGEPASELRSVIPVQDAVNKLIADMMIASEFAGFRQRWATGMTIPKGPDGKPLETFKASLQHLWVTENPEAKFGDFEVTDLNNYAGAISLAVQHIASQSQTPPHYFYLRGEIPSGESIKSAEAGLVAKTTRKMRYFGESWESVIRLAFAVVDDPRQDAFAAETIWRDPEYRTEGEHVDALLKLSTLGVPNEVLWEKWGATPVEIARWKSMGAPAGPQPPALGEGAPAPLALPNPDRIVTLDENGRITEIGEGGQRTLVIRDEFGRIAELVRT